MEILQAPIQDHQWLQRTKEYLATPDPWNNPPSAKVQVMLWDREYFIKKSFFQALKLHWMLRTNTIGQTQRIEFRKTPKRSLRMTANANPIRRQRRRMFWEDYAEETNANWEMIEENKGVLVEKKKENKVNIAVIDLCSSSDDDSDYHVCLGLNESESESQSDGSSMDSQDTESYETCSLHSIESDSDGYLSIKNTQ